MVVMTNARNWYGQNEQAEHTHTCNNKLPILFYIFMNKRDILVFFRGRKNEIETNGFFTLEDQRKTVQ